MPDLPTEIWREIFDIAADDDFLLSPNMFGSMDECEWYGRWFLRTPQESLIVHLRETWFTKRAIVSTCRLWRQTGTEFLFRCILISSMLRLKSLCALLDKEFKLGWWTKRVHVYKDLRGPTKDLTFADLEDGMTSLLRHCPNLTLFISDIPMERTFRSIAETLYTFCPNTLRSFQCIMPHDAQSKAIVALHRMQGLESLRIEICAPDSDTEKSLYKAGGFIEVSLPELEDLCLRGFIQDFVEQVAEWHLPSLSSLCLDFGTNRHDFPDLLEFMSNHGPLLETLDLRSLPTLDVPEILSICVNLHTFCFNLDWALGGTLTNTPHTNIQRLGLHGLRHAFGVGYIALLAAVRPFDSAIARRSNDSNFSALTRYEFPSLKVVRALDPMLLKDLNAANGPKEGACFDRWERWWDQCARQGIRLEDCTGSLLGTLPQDADEISEGSGEEDCDD
ncbi:hypothetical protein BD410DRAFT_719195 [Rickenella mellea]|uniref:F-box domain-containing protein n=1 Tax=Rickenella mellea TaxID=50990 RepID=A0A4Y7QCG6_9AGAM|nr:hypothetical protein BD410DRAFT_719195 [Rickenella mellea]